MMADRRRTNGPSIPTAPPVFLSTHTPPLPPRAPDELRKIFLKTSLTPPATGSAFFELSAPSTLKLTASVYGPRPLPPSAAFSPNARITAELKFAPFSTSGARRGYVRDALERDLSAQLQTALAGSIKASVYPKSGIDVFVTVLDCEGDIDVGAGGLGAMQALAGAVTCASAAVADAGIECVDLVSCGIAARRGNGVVLDPSPLDAGDEDVGSAALVAYMAARDELTLVWTWGEAEVEAVEELVDAAVGVAGQIRSVLNGAVREKLEVTLERNKASEKGKGKEAKEESGDTAMSG
ncbi:3' exoribonuclease family, domain 1-domain-containing protein [Geopyxis carbonaria]|nr:3' exoribonuclease family, domain 1-domain-containing protein [Geopyxis carbonaria]